MINRNRDPKNASAAQRRAPRAASIKSAVRELIMADAVLEIERLDENLDTFVLEVPSNPGGRQ